MVIPTQLNGGNYDGFEKLTISEEERGILFQLGRLARENNAEYAQVIVGGEVSEPFTSGNFDKVAIGKGLTERPHTRIFHAHTNETCFSAEDLMFLINPNVDRIAVVTRDCEVFVSWTDEEFRPTIGEFQKALSDIRVDVDSDIYLNPESFRWTPKEWNYIAIMEQAYRISRYFKWHIEGGRL